jgi:hypothetical protein
LDVGWYKRASDASLSEAPLGSQLALPPYISSSQRIFEEAGPEDARAAMPRVVILFFRYWGNNEVRSWAGGNDIEFPAPPFRVQSPEKQSYRGRG